MREQNQKSNISKFSKYLEKKLIDGLPGYKAHIEMSPAIGTQPYRGFKPSNDARSSAVLLLLTEIEKEINILFTLRSKQLNSHGGQISFPGGMIENDETIEQAALRETFEETNISFDKIIIIGKLSTLYVPPSNSIIHPVIGISDITIDDITISPDEVDEAFFIPLKEFYDENNKSKEIWKFRENDVDVPLWKVHPTPLWGATAMILSEFLQISKNFFQNKILD